MTQKEKFKKLNYEQKRNKLLLFLKGLRTDNIAIVQTIKIIEKHEVVSEIFLEDIYFDLVDFAELLKKKELKKSQEKITNILEKIQQQEQSEKESEDIDQILNQL